MGGNAKARTGGNPEPRQKQTERSMTDLGADNNPVRPLRNVQRLVQLVDRLNNAAFGLERMAVFYGPPGFGKSFAASHCIVAYGAVHIVVQDLWSKSTFLKAVLEELGIKPRGTLADMGRQVQEGLAQTGRTLIVDEADRAAKRGMIEMIRDIHDNSACSVILIGEENLPQSLKKWERVHSRMLEWVGAEPADARDLRMLADHYCPGVEIEDELLAKILKDTSGSIRRITTNCARIKEMATVKGISRVGLADLDIGLYVGEPPSGRGLA